MDTLTTPWSLSFEQTTADSLRLKLAGQWCTPYDLPNIEPIEKQLLLSKETTSLIVDGSGVTAFDSGLVLFMQYLSAYGEQHQYNIHYEHLPAGATRLLNKAKSATLAPKRTIAPTPLTERVGITTFSLVERMTEQIEFVGESIASFSRLFIGKAFFLSKDLLFILNACSIKALGIVSLIAFLVGIILTFIGSVELGKFGAQIYVANLTSIGMSRELAAIMAAIVMAGRTGASFAAQIGTMQVNEEIDALATMAISPMDFIVLPRLLALIVMMPLLVIYANALGNLGGFLVGTTLLNISPMEYFNQAKEALATTDIIIGVAKGLVFGVLVALTGCFRGMQCGRSAQAVGVATTQAVVTAIVYIIVADALIDFMLNILDI